MTIIRHEIAEELIATIADIGTERDMHAMLDTFDFQALSFYEELGYEVFGRGDDFPKGHARYFLAKKLTP